MQNRKFKNVGKESEEKEMEFRKKMLFMGTECKPGFKDPTKLTYRAAFADGMDSIKMYIDPGQYEKLKASPALSVLEVVLDYNPTTQRMNFVAAEYVGEITGNLTDDKPVNEPADRPADSIGNKKAS